jgi:hypothetical protein
MPQVRVIKAFLHRGQTITPGTVMTVPDHALEVLGDFAEVVTLSPADLKMQQASSEWRLFCDSHERGLPGSVCEVKQDRYDPFTHCKGWRIKTGKVTLN